MASQKTAAVVITTYDRYDLLARVLDSIEENRRRPITVYIYDDGSPRPQTYDPSKYNFEIIYNRFSRNHGKTRWYLMIDYIFKRFQAKKYDYYLFTQDDCPFVEGGIEKAIRLYDSVKDPKKAAVGLDNNRGMVKCWTKFQPRPYGRELYLTNWVDMCFICRETFFKGLNWGIHGFNTRSALDPTKSSGVGCHISTTLYKKGYKMYIPLYSVVQHMGNKESKLNPGVRRGQPLVSRLRPVRTRQPVNKSLVSIIITAVQDRGYLGEAILSAKRQTYRPCEIILASDGNPGLKDIADKNGIKFTCTRTRLGQGSNINHAVGECRGEFLKILHDDDLLPQSAIQYLVDGMQRGTTDFVFGNWQVLSRNRKNPTKWNLGVVNKPKSRTVDHLLLAKNNVIHGGTTMYRKSVFDAVGGYDPKMWTGEELEFHLRLLQKGYIARHVDIVSTYYRSHPQQKSTGNRSAAFQEKRRSHIKPMRTRYLRMKKLRRPSGS